LARNTLNRLRKRYKYARWRLKLRAWHNFSGEERRGLQDLARRVDSFRIARLYAVGKDGLLYDGVWRTTPDEPHILKVSLNKGRRRQEFARVHRVVEEAHLPFLCRAPEFGVGEEDPDYWYQIQRKVGGMMVSRYLQLPPRKRLAICDPVGLCIDLLEQTQALNALRIVAPNVDAENVIIQENRSLVRVDLDPYFLVDNGNLPRYPLRRLFRLLHAALADFEPLWRRRIAAGAMGCDPDALDDLFRRLRSSAIYGYDDPSESRHRRDRLVNPEHCFTNVEEPLGLLRAIAESFQTAP